MTAIHRRSSRIRTASLLACLGGIGLASGCDNAGQGAFTGAGLGAASGAIIGSLTGSAGKGALIGAAAGAVGGAVIGDQNQRNARKREY